MEVSVVEHKEDKKRVEKLTVRNPNAAGIDVGSEHHWAAVPPESDPQPVRKFSSCTESLCGMADWLTACGVDTVAMESTGVYWIPLYEILEQRGFKVLLVNAHHLKTVPGRKSDVMDCQWIRELHAFGLLRGSFRPTEEIVELRTYLRHRHTLVRGASSHILRMQKALSLMNVQLHNFIADITGETGIRIIQGILAGNHDPEKLAELRDYRCRATQEQIAASLVGNYRREHLFLLQQAFELYEFHQKQIQACDVQIEKLLKSLCGTVAAAPGEIHRHSKRRPKEPKIDIYDSLCGIAGVDLTKIPGISNYTALVLISEFGTDMSRWPSESHFASWLHLAPGTKITGGKRLSGRTPPGNGRAANLLRLAATAAGRTQTAIGAFYRRLSARLGKVKAVVATAHKLARIIYGMLKHREAYKDPGAPEYNTRQRKRRLRSLDASARVLGYRLVPIEEPQTLDMESCEVASAVS